MNLGEIAVTHGAAAAKIIADLAMTDPEGAELIARAVMQPEFILEKAKVSASEKLADTRENRRITESQYFKARKHQGV